MRINYYRNFFLVLLALLNTACLRFVHYQPGVDQNSPSATKVVTHHRVKTGETLYSIAFEYGRDYRDVAQWNGIKRPYTIYPKQNLRVIPISSDDKKVSNRKTAKTRNRVATRAAPPERPESNSKLVWQWPTKGAIESTFSIRDPGRRGIDIVGRKGQSVNAAAAGRVVYRGNGLRGYGNLIILKHNNTFFSAYAHTEDVVVKENQRVKLGQKLADMGDTSTNKPKLHFEIRRNGKPVNPLRYLPKRH